MGQFFQVNGDYNIKCRSGGTIVLDPGSTGQVLVTGNLNVEGLTTTVNSTDLDIEDNIITLNKGEAGPGVSLIYSGIEIDRGRLVDSTTVAKAALVWNETNPGFTTAEDPASGSGYWMVATGSAQDGAVTYGFNDSNLKLRRILTDVSTDSGDLTLIGTGTGVVKVAGTTNYRLQVTDADDIPNKDYVDYSILNNPTFQIRSPNTGLNSSDTRIIIADKDVTPNLSGTAGSMAYYLAQTSVPISESGVGIFVDNVLNTTFYSNRTVIQGLEFSGTEITNDNTNSNIFIRTNGTGKLQTNYALQIDRNPVTPATVTGSHVLYSATEGAGSTGFYFATTTRRDEFISKNKALVFSMLF